ncbi:ABC-F family ATP-binding cassette domain-containing protein [Ligilactobacillus apodemi]|uniref:ABC transporter ATP-binding protein n=1 Tax=Ligilactobacillus apodemi DSM 16634 = JCM 16172 TaxID=1423724 RepID=A0A0R1TV69_9LACO|nr:ABC-F family ATP-binding cassette domain-containing protein [Ligilactobacillus apodemi]KRL85132.1 ABC transporter ATP-binding protein [Ligilactobacillus apodemi DSM 16634 = JCM 16172]MCR1902110.1 ATP-binding cassette domain-containing protein [Ligilactobacillus apodemi]
MSILEVTDLSMSFADKQLYDKASFALNKEDHLGVIGQNGAGKSTLIRLITGQILPDEGQIKWQRGKKIGYLDQYAESAHELTIGAFLQSAFQELYEIEKKQAACYEKYAQTLDENLLDKAGKYQEILEAADFYNLEVKIDQVMTGLGIDALGKERKVSQCSGGQRSKIILAKLLLERPDVLLLDEPTNYLDVAHIEWLTDYLNDFPGCFMVISHDYDFLENITNTIADISFGKITKYTGSFKAAIKQKEVKKEVQLKAYEKQRRQIEKDEAYIRKNKAGTRAAMAKSRQKRLDKLVRLTPPSDNLQAHFSFPYLELLSSATLRVKKLSIGYQRPLLQPVTFSMSHGEKVVLKGFNGIGKSTLLKSILGEIKTFGGTAQFVDAAVINYFTQELVWDDPQMTPLQVLQAAYPKLEPKTIRQRLARAGINAANTLKPMELLSGGEQTKVKLCLLELKPSNFLILDEPTNHLDDETKVALKKALIDFPGNVLLVTHEESFYQGWIDKIFNVENIQLER